MKTYTVQVKYTVVVKVISADTEAAVTDAMEEAETVIRSGEGLEIDTHIIHVGR